MPDLTYQELLNAVAREQGIIITPQYDPALDCLIGERDAAPLCGVAVRTMQDMRQKGSGPTYIQVSDGKRGRVAYTPRACIMWRQLRIRRSTSDAAMRRHNEKAKPKAAPPPSKTKSPRTRERL